MRGFTLFELILSIIISGIVFAIAIPRFYSAATFNDRFFYDDVLAALSYAHAFAMAGGCNVQFNITSTSYNLQTTTKDSNQNCTSTPQEVKNPSTNSGSYTNTTPTGLTFTASTNPIYFTAAGRAQSSNTGTTPTNVTITVGSRNISVVGESGFIQ